MFTSEDLVDQAVGQFRKQLASVIAVTGEISEHIESAAYLGFQ